MTAPMKVICAKPRIGIISPSISNDTPAAWTTAAAAVVTAAPISPDTTVARRNVHAATEVNRTDRLVAVAAQ